MLNFRSWQRGSAFIQPITSSTVACFRGPNTQLESKPNLQKAMAMPGLHDIDLLRSLEPNRRVGELRMAAWTPHERERADLLEVLWVTKRCALNKVLIVVAMQQPHLYSM